MIWIHLISCIVLFIITHELGHVWALKEYGKKPKLSFNKKSLIVNTSFKGLNKDQITEVYLRGIITGSIVILSYALIINAWFTLLLIPYTLMSGSDIKQIKKIRKCAV